MADSKINSIDSSEDDLADDLDAILNDLGSSNEDQDELIDDEDAIDRLLMDDDFGDSETESTSDVADQTINEKSDEDAENVIAETQDVEFDEFTNDDKSGANLDDVESSNKEVNNNSEVDNNDFDVDDLIDSAKSDASTEEDEFAEIGDVTATATATATEDKTISGNGEQKEEIISEDRSENGDGLAEDGIDPEPETLSDDDFLMADFDISADDGFEQTNDDIEGVDEVVDVEIDEEKTTIVSPIVNENLEKNNAAIIEISAQISQLCVENETLKQKIVELTSSSDEEDPTAAEIETLQKEQRKLRKTIKENETKVPVITYVAIGIAIFALLMGGGLGAIGYGAQSDVTELTELVSTLEEEIEILSTKDTSREIVKINEKINLLTANDDFTNNAIEQVKQTIQSNPLRPTIEDLVSKNDKAQVAIEQLSAKVNSLEKRKVVTTVRKKPKKIVAKVTWVVNLVAFRQEWYAKRKAVEFEKKAVPAEVIKVNVKGEDWFRLRVIGFKTKYEAAAYAVKVKKALNLSSVWVTKA